jgi:hypothetical protein
VRPPQVLCPMKHKGFHVVSTHLLVTPFGSQLSVYRAIVQLFEPDLALHPAGRKTVYDVLLEHEHEDDSRNGR